MSAQGSSQFPSGNSEQMGGRGWWSVATFLPRMYVEFGATVRDTRESSRDFSSRKLMRSPA
jgi:hypothetical protein